jgi:hypothetical protein
MPHKVLSFDKQNKSKKKKNIFENTKPSTVLVIRDDSRAKSVSLMMTLNLADASTEYFKDKDLKKDDVITFMSWVKKQPHLPKINGEYDIKLARNFLKWYSCRTPSHPLPAKLLLQERGGESCHRQLLHD